MPAPLAVPTGENTALGVGKETTPGTAVVPTLWHAHNGFIANEKNIEVPRTSARKRLGKTYPGTGVYELKLTMTVESDPDTVGQLIAFGLGNQATPVASGASVVAKAQTLTLGTPLPSFTCQINRVTDAVAYSGCKVASMDFAMDAKGGLVCKFTLEALTMSIVTAASPTFSTKLPLQFHNSASFLKYKNVIIGATGSVAVLSWNTMVNNSLVDTYYSFGNGRFKMAIPENERAVSGKMQLGFETNAAYLDFIGGTTSPGAVIPGVSIEAYVASTDLADPGALLIPYGIDFLMANCFLESDDIDIKSSGPLEQPIVFTCAESANGLADDLKVTLTNLNAVIY